MDNNISRILYEVENNLQWIATSRYNYSFNAFTRSTDTPYNLAMAFIANYERPAEPNQPIRGTQAQAWYEYLDDDIPSGVYEARIAPFIREIFEVTAEFRTISFTVVHITVLILQQLQIQIFIA